MGTATTKQDRIGARVPSEVYQTLCRAAQLSGATVNQFLVQSALKEAQAVNSLNSAVYSCFGNFFIFTSPSSFRGYTPALEGRNLGGSSVFG